MRSEIQPASSSKVSMAFRLSGVIVVHDVLLGFGYAKPMRPGAGYSVFSAVFVACSQSQDSPPFL